MRNNHGDELDRIIDEALSGYSEAARPGLEQRVRNRIRIAEADRRRSRFFRFAMAIATAMLLLAIALGTRRNSAPKITQVARDLRPSAETKPAPAVPDRRVRVAARRSVRARSLPKEQQFPVVAPFTSAERALLAFVEQHPLEAQQVVAEMQKRSNEPIEVPAIQIQPLRSDGQQ